MNKILYGTFSFFLFLMSTLPSLAGEQVRITAVAATGKDIHSQVSKVAARAPYYIFFDEENRLLGAERNPHAEATRGAGVKAADYLGKKKVQKIIAGQFGQKMLSRLQTHNIQAIRGQGSVIDILKKE